MGAHAGYFAHLSKTQTQSCTKICEQILFLLQHSDKSGDDNHLPDVNRDKHNCLV